MEKLINNLKKFSKWFAVGGIALVVLLVLAVVFLPKLLNLESVRNFAAKTIQKQIGRQVTIDKVRFSVFSGVELGGIVIANDPSFSARPMVKINKVVLKYKFWPLVLKRQLVVEEAGIDGMDYVFEIRGYKTNIDSITKYTYVPPAVEKDKVTDLLDKTNNLKKQAEQLQQLSEGSFQFNIKKVYLTNSNIDYITWLEGTPRPLSMERVNFVVTNINNHLDKSPALINCSFVMQAMKKTKSKVNFKGRLTGPLQAVLDVNIDQINNDDFMEIYVLKNAPKVAAKPGAKPTFSYVFDFSPLQGFYLDLNTSIDKFIYDKMHVENIRSSVTLKDMRLSIKAKTDLYDGRSDFGVEVNLKGKGNPFSVSTQIEGVNSHVFLSEAFNINKFVRGKLSASAQVNASLANAIGLNGLVKTHFEDGAVLDASKFKDLGEDKVMSTIVGLFKESHFKDLYLDLAMNNGKPALKYFKLIETGGKVTEIDFTKDLGKLLENQVKKEIDTAVDKEKERIQKEIDDKAKAEKERLENEVKNQLQNIKF
jgi:hypothetical protein